MGKRPIILYVVGTRPEFIRSADILHYMRKHKEYRTLLVHTGQHFDWNMSTGFLLQLQLGEPDIHLGSGGRTRSQQVASLIESFTNVITETRPSAVCVFGDTNSSLATALAACIAKVPVVHIEAGARSYDMSMPEEVNRRLIDHMSDLLLPVSDRCAHNLKIESVRGGIVNTGDPLYDVFSRLFASTQQCDDSDMYNGGTVPFCLLTLHREQLVDDRARLVETLHTISSFAVANSLDVIFPVHPRTRRSLSDQDSDQMPRVRLIDPLLYEQFLTLLGCCCLIITDSGGLQKEAYWAGKPCVTVRDTTEWVETIDAGVNVLAMDDKLLSALQNMYELDLHIFSQISNPYGDGSASQRIASVLADHYGLSRRTSV
ncbi:MAG: UDP-N-acetylglucosamine 2-epimerase (non-hydrolyzing) [Chloroflexi bacterium]|nr:UDP-N-acetylglucosamine 2-epimerase (non-hydrolyzing) [Chloroflexota bacterium]